jgi:hypothetical protein
MGKIVKYCNACEEGFAEKFAFCPNCGSGLTAFELNPVPPKVSEDVSQPEQIISAAKTENEVTTTKLEPTFTESNFTINEPIVKAETPVVVAPIIEKVEEPTISFNEKFEEIVTPIEPEKTVTISGFTPMFTQAETKQFSDDEYLGDESAPIHFRPVEETEYRPTFVEDKNRGGRMRLLLGSMALVFTVLAGSWIYSLFAKSLSVDSIDDQIFAYVTPPTDEPFDSEKPPKEKKKGEVSGGGGGGGDNDPKPASAGRDARMVEEPLIAPDKSITKVTKPDIPFQAAVKGPKKEYNEDENLPYGVKGATINDPSNGPGSNGGQGEGRNGGQGPGEGPGIGPGRNGGKGGGDKGGLGPGSGPGGNPDDNDPPPPRPTPKPKPEPTPKPAPVANTFKITSQPRANYSDAGRQNNVNGVVRLKVTFLASGQIGGISVVSGLPYGLTEQAIAAARNIKFIPGASTVSKTLEYRFTLY